MTEDPVNHNYPYNTDGEQAPGIPAFDGNFHRINVILGANGTGKSRFITHLKGTTGATFKNKSVVYVEGGRVVPPPDTLEIDKASLSFAKNFQAAKTTHQNLRPGTLKNRIKQAFILLKKQGDEIKIAHSDAADNWYQNKSQQSHPTRQESPIEKLFSLFNEIFPHLILKFNTGTDEITCEKNGIVYSPSGLSDGEKQVLCLLADVSLLSDLSSLVLVDEPELNLHPLLANRLWDVIESSRPEAVFVYATHSISFAMRESVRKIFVLDGSSGQAQEIENIIDINENELRKFLGSIGAILSTKHAMLVEGNTSSFDAIFYPWILDDKSTSIIPHGGSDEVISAVSGSGIWSKLSSGSIIIGVVDRDYRSDGEILELCKNNCYVLNYHEAESYLCVPSVVRKISECLGLTKSLPSEQEITDVIVNHFESECQTVAAKRTFRRTSLNLNLSIPRSVIRKAKNKESVKIWLEKEAADKLRTAGDHFNPDAVSEIYDNELSICEKTLADGNIDEILKLASGKELLKKLSKKAGCGSPEDFVRAARKHLKIEDFPNLKSLRTELQNRLSPSDGS